MCGICGFIGPNGWVTQGFAESLLGSMCASIAHRGNDANGQHVDAAKGLALGHQRLSIIDIEGGVQPLTNEGRNAWIVFNGEIYNFQDLRIELASLGHQFQTNSDTEVILQAYLEWGESCVDKLHGMFAFAIWDTRYESLFCARDRMGQKPFYYSWDGQHFVFASEIKAILQHSDVDREQDLDAFRNFLQYQYVPAPNTIFKSIKKLPAATSLRLSGNNIKLNRYWDISAKPVSPDCSEDEYVERLRAQLEDAVSSHMNSDVPLGAFLSGGVDSSAIVGLMTRNSTRSVKTHTASFSNIEFDESQFARAVSEHFQTDHEEKAVEMKVAEDLEKIIYHMDEPFADASAIPTYYVCREARKRVTVCLSGDGGDELFAGYNWYSELIRLMRIKQAVPAALTSALSRVLGSLLPGTIKGASLVRNLGLASMDQHSNLMRCFSSMEIERICHLGPGPGSKEASVDPLAQAYRDLSDEESDVVKTAQRVDFQTYLAEDVLMKVDKMSMAHGLESRSPLLDHKLVELVMGMPTRLKIRGNDRKLIFKQSIEDLVPAVILARGKKGFGAPIGQWLMEDQRERFGDLLLSPNSQDSGMFDRVEVEKLWNKFSHNKLHVGLDERLWTLFCYETWHSIYHQA